MAGYRATVLIPSVLDRLIWDNRPGQIGAVQPGSLAALKDSVQRDLDALLNTRRAADLVPADFEIAAASLVNFGLPDFAGYSLRTPADQQRLRRDIEAAIRTFEPRLAKVVVKLEGWDDANPVLQFRVEAVLKVEPEPEPVSFDTVFHADMARFAVKGRAR